MGSMEDVLRRDAWKLLWALLLLLNSDARWLLVSVLFLSEHMFHCHACGFEFRLVRLSSANVRRSVLCELLFCARLWSANVQVCSDITDSTHICGPPSSATGVLELDMHMIGHMACWR